MDSSPGGAITEGACVYTLGEVTDWGSGDGSVLFEEEEKEEEGKDGVGGFCILKEEGAGGCCV